MAPIKLSFYGAFLLGAAALGIGAQQGLEGPSPWANGFAPDVVQDSSNYSNTTIESRDAASFYLRIMPLGASITYGFASTDGNGYRKWLREELRYQGWNVNMVGSVQSGSMADNDNEGHPGWVISQVQGAVESSISMHPNLFLINAGTNDCIQNIDINNTGSRMKSMIDYIFAQVPSTTVILSTLVPNGNSATNTLVQNVNQQFRDLVSSSYAGQRVVIADMEKFITLSDIGPDGIHPTNAGYEKMASVWWDAFQKIQGSIQAPDTAVNDSAATGGSNTCEKVAGNAPPAVQTQQGSGYDDGDYVHSSTAQGTIISTDQTYGPESYFFAQLVNSGGAPRGQELDEIVLVAKQGDGSFKYSFKLNNGGGSYASSWTSFASPLGCSGDVAHHFADLNNDGLDDLWCIGSAGQASVAINQGGNPPTFSSIGQIIGSPGSYVASDIRIADIDGDGRADYCLIHSNEDIACWRNGGQDNTVGYWQGFTAADTPGDVVFTGKGKGNKSGFWLGDLNGDFRSDWMFIGDTGNVETYINQRGWGSGIVPNWIYPGLTHPGMATAGAGSQIKFGRVFGSGRLDYIWIKPVDDTYEFQVWQNQGAGGTRLKADGDYYCDMTGSGSDDYVWVWSDGHAAEFYGNIHDPPNWNVGSKALFDIQRSRRSIHIADWDGDGRCDILSQRQSDGALEMWRNIYDSATGNFNFTYQGFVTGSATCTEGWGVGIFDRGLRLADIDGDGRADYLCMEKNGRVTGYLNTAGGLQNVGQIKLSEGWDRANMRWADVEAHGKADLLWVDKYTGATTVFQNMGNVPVAGSSFTWNNRGVLYSPIDRGANMNFANLGGKGRADLMDVLPVSNTATTYFNVCPGGGDDGPIVDPGLPAYSS